MIVPAYNAEGYILKNLTELQKILKRTKKSFEIICVIDGATDETEKQAEKAKKRYREIEVIAYSKNQGKGYALKYGMERAGGKIIGFIDAGRDINYEDILVLLKLMIKEKADIVVGSKRHLHSQVFYTGLGKYFSYGYQFYVKILFNLSVSDTQAGIKLFKRKIIKKVLSALCVKGFAFDIEILSVSEKYMDARIIEAPIRVRLDESASSIKIKGGFIINSLSVFLDTLAVFYRLKISGYYKNKILKL